MSVPRILARLRVHRGPTAQVDGPLRHTGFAVAGSLGDSFNHVAVGIAGGEGHLRIESRRVLTQRRFHDALMLYERAPIASAHIPQARDAVGHHELREREALRRQCDRVLGGQP